MNRLLVDAGNSRVKWARAQDGEPGPSNALEHRGDADSATRRILDCEPDLDEAVLVDVTDSFARALAARLPTRRLEPSHEAAGVRCAYAEPATLGADRWAALLGARNVVTGACCIADAGTALTVDVLAADGRHLGGWVAPGLRMSVETLVRGTRRIRPPDVIEWAAPAPGSDTARAVSGGALLAALGFVDRAVRAATDALGTEPALVLTGGDAAVLERGLPGALRVDDLVLRGLAAWAAG